MGDEGFMRQSGIAAATAMLFRFLFGPVDSCRRRHYFSSKPCNTASHYTRPGYSNRCFRARVGICAGMARL